MAETSEVVQSDESTFRNR